LVSLRCSAHRPRASKARTLLHELQAVFRSAALPWERSVIAIARSRPSRLGPHIEPTTSRWHRRLDRGESLVERGVEGIDEKERTQLRRSGLPFRRVTESRLF
jgi:hypothetical protein